MKSAHQIICGLLVVSAAFLILDRIAGPAPLIRPGEDYVFRNLTAMLTVATVILSMIFPYRRL